MGPLKRFVLRVIPWRALAIGVLTILTVPALAVGLMATGGTLVAGGTPASYPTPAIAALLVAAPLAVLLLAVSATSLRARHRHHRQLREEARRTNTRLASIIGATEDAIVLLDLDGSVRAWNPAAERLYGVAADEALGRPYESFIDMADASSARDAFLVVVAADRRVTTESRHLRPNGTFPAVTTWAAVRADDGSVDGVAVLVRDPEQATPAARAHASRTSAPGGPSSVPATQGGPDMDPAAPPAGPVDLADPPGPRPADPAGDPDRRATDSPLHWLRLLLATAPDAVVSCDDTGRIIGWNRAAEGMFGIGEAQALALTLADILVALDGESPCGVGDWLGQAGGTATVEGRRADGTTFPAELAMSTWDHAGHASFTAFVRDITERRAAEEREHEHEARYQRLVEHLPGVVYRAKVGRWAPVTYISPELKTMLGYAPEEWVGVNGIWEDHIHPADLQRVLAEDDAEAAASADEALREDREYRMRTRTGTEIWVRDHAHLERDADGNPIAWNGFLTDITDRKQLESQLVKLAFHDSLTGLANRALLNDRIAHAIARRQREVGAIAMLVVDLDDFKLVNDAHGHDTGDRIIAAAAERLRGCVRADATIARLGGDEFAILLDGLSDDAAALVVAQRVVRAFDKPLRVDGATIAIRVSVGVAVDVTGQRPGSWLTRSADTAMYEAKRLGKGRWQAYDPAAHLASAKRLVFESELRRAVERRQFALVYQPIVELQTGSVVGCEALIRWNHPTRGLVGPTEFISTLEATGLIEPVGRWVIDQACQQAAAWATQLPSLQWTAVNVSASQLANDAFPEAVRAALTAHRLDPARLTLEVTEGLALDDSGETVERLRRLRELGCRIAVDDFGTGYSSLSYLRRLPIDRIKIDRAFVDGLGSDPEAITVTRAIVDLARGLNLGTVAEGIEHRGQAQILTALGCQLGQGYLFAKPLRASDLTALVAGRQAAAALRGDGAEHAVA